MADQVITIVIDGKRRDVIARKYVNKEWPNRMSNTYILLTLDGHSTNLYLKDVVDTERAGKEHNIIPKNELHVTPLRKKDNKPYIPEQTLQLKHLIAKFRLLKKIGIPTEPYRGFYVDPYDHAYYITEAVGQTLHDIFEKNIHIIQRLGLTIANEILSIMVSLHNHGFSHRHTHAENFTLYKDKVYIIDVAMSRRDKNIFNKNWKEIYNFFNVDYGNLDSVFFVLHKRDVQFPYPLELLFLNFYARLIDSYPISIDSKYKLLANALPNYFKHDNNIYLPPHVDTEILYSHQDLKELRKIISKWKEEDSKMFPNLWRTEVHV